MARKHAFKKLCIWCHCSVGSAKNPSYFELSDGRSVHLQCVSNVEIGDAGVVEKCRKPGPFRQYAKKDRPKKDYKVKEKFE